VRIEDWNGHSIRFVEKDGEWQAVAKDVCEALGYLPETQIKVSQKEFLYDGRFILSKEEKVYYECDFYGNSEDIIIPNVVMELTSYIQSLDNSGVRERFIHVTNSALYNRCMMGWFITKHPSDCSKLIGAISSITDYDKWFLKNQTKFKSNIAKKEDNSLCGVYLIQADNGLTKIGCTKNIINRFSVLKTSSPCDLKIIGFVNSTSQYDLEREIHNYFSDRRVKGEWFDLSEAELMALDERFGLGLSVSAAVYHKYAPPKTA
jgi:hypothetical protein